MLPVTNVITSTLTSSGMASCDSDSSANRLTENPEEITAKLVTLVEPSAIVGNQDFEAVASSSNTYRSSIAKGKTGFKPVMAFPQRKHPINVDLKVEEIILPAKKVTSTRTHRVRNKRQTSVSEKVKSPLIYIIEILNKQ